jgi:hypothetical protein
LPPFGFGAGSSAAVRAGEPFGVVPAVRLDQDMRLGPGIGPAFGTRSEEGASGGGRLHVEPVVADQRDHLALGEQAELAEHLAGDDARAGELLDDIVGDALS